MKAGLVKQAPQGFTLMEAMMTITLMGVIASVAWPTLSAAFKRQAMNSATQDVMGLVDFARVQASSRNRAYRLRVTTNGGVGAQGQIVVDESSNTLCSGLGGGQSDIRSLSFGEMDLKAIRVIGTFPASLDLCFLPDGRVIDHTTSKPVLSVDAAFGAGDAQIAIQTIDTSGQPNGIIHRVIVPYNGIPRFRPGPI